VRSFTVNELESGDELLRFSTPFAVTEEKDPDGTVSYQSPLLNLAAAGRGEDEAWEMFSALIVGTYREFIGVHNPPVFPLARQQWQAVRSMAARHYVLQPV
jgi:hypothetical protein